MIKDKIYIFEKEKVSKAILTFSIPTIISQLIDVIYNMADLFFLGKVNNPIMLAGVILASTIFMICVPLSNVLGIGGGGKIARMLGSGEKGCENVSSFSIYGSIIISLLFSLITFIFLKPLLYLLGASVDSFVYAKQYIMIVVVYGMPIAVVSKVLAHLLRNAGYSRESGIGLSGGGILNIILDPIFMFIIFPKGNEVIAAATATLISGIISTIYLAIVMMKISKEKILSLNPFDSMKVTWYQIQDVFGTGLPAGILPLLYDVLIIVANATIAKYGDIPLASLGIAFKVDRIPTSIGLGISTGMLPIIAYNYAAKNYNRMKDTINIARWMGIISAVVCGILMYGCASIFAEIFVSGEDTNSIVTYQLSKLYIKYRSIIPILMFLCYHSAYSLQAIACGKEVFIIQFIRIMALNVPGILIFDKLFGQNAVVWSFLISETLASMIAIGILNNTIKQKIN